MTQAEPDRPPPDPAQPATTAEPASPAASAEPGSPGEPDFRAVLAGRAGHYRGRGIDQDGTGFDGTLTVLALAGGAAVVLDIGVEQPGEPAYQEHGVLAQGEDGAAQYISVSSNAPFHRTFRLRRTEQPDGAARAVFGWGGPPEQTSGFREEITLTVYGSGDLGLGWAWGAPGGAFGPRSAVHLSPA